MLISQVDRFIIRKYINIKSWKRPMGADMIVTRYELLKISSLFNKFLIRIIKRTMILEYLK